MNIDAWVGLLDERGKSVFARQFCTFVNGVNQTGVSYAVTHQVRIEGFDVAKDPLGPALMFGKLSVPLYASPLDIVQMIPGSIEVKSDGVDLQVAFGGGASSPSPSSSPTISWDDKTVLPEYSTPYPELEKWAEETGNYFADMMDR